MGKSKSDSNKMAPAGKNVDKVKGDAKKTAEKIKNGLVIAKQNKEKDAPKKEDEQKEKDAPKKKDEPAGIPPKENTTGGNKDETPKENTTGGNKQDAYAAAAADTTTTTADA